MNGSPHSLLLLFCYGFLDDGFKLIHLLGHFLLKGECPVIVVLARRMYAKLPKEWRDAINVGKMLIVSTSQSSRQSQQTSATRNHYVAEISDAIYIAGITERSSLQSIIQEYPNKCILM